MSKTIEIPDIAQWEETDSELAKYTIGKLQGEIEKLKNEIYQLNLDKNELMKTGFECCDKVRNKYKSRIDKAIEYIRSNEWGEDYKKSNCRTHLLNILEGVSNE